MTIRDLSQLYYLRKEIAHDEERLGRLRAQMGSVSSPLCGAGTSGEKVSRTERIVVELVDLEKSIDKKIQQMYCEKIRIERYISTVEDSRIRLILKLRFVEGVSWAKTAVKVGGGNTADSVRKACFRYLKSEKN